MEEAGDPLKMLYAEAFIPLPITPEHTMELKTIENLHSDPFDRIQIAQAKTENLTLITHDRIILKYSHLRTIKS